MNAFQMLFNAFPFLVTCFPNLGNQIHSDTGDVLLPTCRGKLRTEPILRDLCLFCSGLYPQCLENAGHILSTFRELMDPTGPWQVEEMVHRYVKTGCRASPRYLHHQVKEELGARGREVPHSRSSTMSVQLLTLESSPEPP